MSVPGRKSALPLTKSVLALWVAEESRILNKPAPKFFAAVMNRALTPLMLQQPDIAQIEFFRWKEAQSRYCYQQWKDGAPNCAKFLWRLTKAQYDVGMAYGKGRAFRDKDGYLTIRLARQSK